MSTNFLLDDMGLDSLLEEMSLVSLLEEIKGINGYIASAVMEYSGTMRGLSLIHI